MQLWSATEAVIDLALSDAGIARDAIAAIGITAQRGNVVMWDAKTGDPVAPLVSWQDTRGTARAAELIAQGFLVSHQMAAAKIEAVLDAVERGRERIRSTRCCGATSTPISRGAFPAARYTRWITARPARPVTTTTSRASGIRR